MTHPFIALFAYLIDTFFGEFSFIKHPIILIGEVISFFEKRWYKASIFRGFLLVVFVLGIVGSVVFVLDFILRQFGIVFYIMMSSFLASMFLAHKMLYDCVKKIPYAKDKKKAIAMLVSRDTLNMSESDIYKAGIETYAENLSDGVIAPLFYLFFFSLPGIVLYKTINTMDSMVGYRNARYEKFGKVAAYLDDIVNFIPARITALLLIILKGQKDIWNIYQNAKKHKSPNAGYPITVMGYILGVKLGGDTSYFGKIEKKPFFGIGREDITQNDLLKAISFRYEVDIFIVLVLIGFILYGS
ncbi:Adenosylcobinamide-phosphate synthase [hydrothermal vent metagenome]|uniref:Adenosylcobinamide-phosphate synthase n=1 Tax=hydrothermal vent metagenome TaxID=652676 RepID=A0A1W1D385_9ZZZZ